MNLLEIRTEFIKQSGRYDLVTDATSWADNGANFYINSGQDYLDVKGVKVPESEGRLFKTTFVLKSCFRYPGNISGSLTTGWAVRHGASVRPRGW